MSETRGDKGRSQAALGLAWLTAVGSVEPLKLLKEKGPDALWAASPSDLEGWGMRPAAAGDFVKKREQLEWGRVLASLAQPEVCFLPFGLPGYPAELEHLDLPPAGLFVMAASEVWEKTLALPRIAIVGTRRMTSYGARVTEQFAAAFARTGVVVVSGLALGVDTVAHRTALECEGLTVAVLGCGVDVIYPPRNRGLYEKLRSAGALVSEFPPGCTPTRWNFPRRNRIMAALGDAVLITEASPTSGALQTATWALTLGKPVFTVPGSIYDPNHQGCNLLLYDGAFPALDPDKTVQDFLRETRIARGGRELPQGPGPRAVQSPTQPSLGDEFAYAKDQLWREILQALSKGPCSVDNLLEASGRGVRELTVALTQMELAGVVARAGPGMYVRCL